MVIFGPHLRQTEQNRKKELELLYQKHGNGMYQFALFVTGSEFQAKEVVQDVFISIWQNTTLDLETLSKPYLYKSVKNRSLNAIRNNKIKNELLDAPPDDSVDTAYNAQQMLEYQQLEKTVAEAVNQLPEACKAVFLMKRRDGLSHKEIASILDISEKTIENQITRAHKIIRTFLKNKMDE